MNIFSTRKNTEAIVAMSDELTHIRRQLEHLESAPPLLGDLVDLPTKTEKLRGLVGNVHHRLEVAEATLEQLEAGWKDIVIAVSEGIERTDRAERRIKATVRRARKELEERGLIDPALEAENHELPDVDGERGNRDGLQPVPRRVAPAAPQASSIKGVSLETLHRVRSI